MLFPSVFFCIFCKSSRVLIDRDLNDGDINNNDGDEDGIGMVIMVAIMITMVEYRLFLVHKFLKIKTQFHTMLFGVSAVLDAVFVITLFSRSDLSVVAIIEICFPLFCYEFFTTILQ